MYSASLEEIIKYTIQHVQMVSFAGGLSILVGIPLGFLVTKRRFPAFSPFIIGGVNILQTVPSLAIVAIALPLLGAGFKPAVLALFAYGLLPIVRNTYAGINHIDESIIESAKGMGMTSRQIVKKIEIPLAVPIIMAGIRTSVVINVGTATLASLIGAGGLGDLIITGIDLRAMTLMLQGAVPTAVLAILFETLLSRIEYVLTPEGIRLS